MSKQNKSQALIPPTAAQDAAINAGIAADPDTMELTPELAARLQPLRRRGRPPLAQPKQPVTMRLDADILAALKQTGEGWQTRVNQLLREALQQGRIHA